MSAELRAMVAGCGGMSQHWLNILTKEPGLIVVGLCDVAPGRARERADQFGLKDAVTGEDYPALLDTLKPDIVFDLSVPEAHYAITMEAFRRGCHVLGEKPLADSMAHAREMVGAAKKAGVLYAVMQNRRYDARIRRFRALLDSGALGELTTVNADFYLGPHFDGFREEMDHVLLLDMAIHHFDAARYVTGADPVSVLCHEWNPKGSWYRHGASTVAVFEMSNGVVYTYRGSWCANGLGTTWECDWRAVCTDGTALWDGADAFRCERVKSQEGFTAEFESYAIPEIDAGGKRDGHAGCVREFLACVRDGGVPETLASDNIKSLAMVFGAIESAATGRRISIEA